MERRNFIKGCVCAACLSVVGCGLLNVKKNSNADVGSLENNGEDDSLHQMEVHLVEHCNLKCKYCSHFAPLAKEEYYDLKEFDRDFKRLAYVTKGKLKQIQLLGGEPLLNPNIEEYIEITRKYFPDSIIDIITNGILLASKKDSFWKTMKENNVNCTVSLYPVKRDWNTIFRNAEKYGVNLQTEVSGGSEKLNYENIKKYQVKNFYKVQLDPDKKQPIDKKCKVFWGSANFRYGKLYPCFFIANIRHFNSYFNQNFEVTERDFVDIYKVGSVREINKFLNSVHDFCGYCTKDFGTYEPWEATDKHTIDEWMRL